MHITALVETMDTILCLFQSSWGPKELGEHYLRARCEIQSRSGSLNTQNGNATFFLITKLVHETLSLMVGCAPVDSNVIALLEHFLGHLLNGIQHYLVMTENEKLVVGILESIGDVVGHRRNLSLSSAVEHFHPVSVLLHAHLVQLFEAASEILFCVILLYLVHERVQILPVLGRYFHSELHSKLFRQLSENVLLFTTNHNCLFEKVIELLEI
mmetsp:Transcript_1143/g.3921  ORF Transcript_1143/g.3921 Transcript_1143/m.3921 type:complete len:213 (+) Transcript_1143:1827-2465(+)